MVEILKKIHVKFDNNIKYHQMFTYQKVFIKEFAEK